MRLRHWGCVFVLSLVASSAGAVEFFVPVPHLGGNFVYRTEFVRQDLNKINVDFTYIREGQSGAGRVPVRYKVLPGPSTDRNHPLLTDNYNRDFNPPPQRSDPKFFLPGGGLVVMEGEQGLLGAETAVILGGEPTSGWELPMLTESDAFAAGQTVYVLNLMRGAGTSSQLSIFNVDSAPARCQVKLLAANGRVLDQRASVTVPARGAARIQDIVSRTVTGAATGMSATVNCNRLFYALGSFPAASMGDVRVHYPSTEPPTLGTREIFVNNESWRVVNGNSEKRYTLPLTPNTRYRSILIDFDVTTSAPTNPAYFRSLVGMWRPEPDRRFGKKLYFGTVERFDRSKLMMDLGTPFIEILVKRSNAPLRNNRTYHFHIEIDADQKMVRKVVTLNGAVVADFITGLFNDDLITRNGYSLIVGLGLPGIADGAYSPPYNWRFSRIVISGYR